MPANRALHRRLSDALGVTNSFCHGPLVIGELACGNLSNRAEVLALLAGLPQAPLASNAEVLFFVERHALMGRGIGWVDAHLLSAAALAGTATLWTRDRRLLAVASALDLVH